MQPLLALRPGSHNALRRRASQRSLHCNEFFPLNVNTPKGVLTFALHTRTRTQARAHAPAHKLLRTSAYLSWNVGEV